MDKEQLTAEALKNLLRYEPDTGSFIWIKRCGKRGVVGKVAGTVDFGGYVVVTICGKRHKAHRLAWLYVHGRWPTFAMDHINGIRTDNRLSNLREATCAENQQNRGKPRNNKSGMLGVSWSGAAGKWRASIRLGGKGFNLGSFDRQEDAHAAYLSAKSEKHRFQPVPRNA